MSSSKTVASQTKEGFKTKKEATAWAEKALEEFTLTQAKNNEKKAEQRVAALKIRQDGSERKAAKTAETKEKLAASEEVEDE